MKVRGVPSSLYGNEACESTFGSSVFSQPGFPSDHPDSFGELKMLNHHHAYPQHSIVNLFADWLPDNRSCFDPVVVPSLVIVSKVLGTGKPGRNPGANMRRFYRVRFIKLVKRGVKWPWRWDFRSHKLL
ncbi:hypothetical protein PoB_004450600 [Plakobranchus ocellatus]|uniref:Uncharacterized protein n=1 Tax=Plakobranchus ocellatus TaxID=259542 RepID=A0AAV4BGM5_9GAST|nr:hypothetical protein PoB_004450600 [Plakobranchus ocellatus]